MSQDEPLGFVSESGAFDRASGVIRPDVDIRPGSYLRLRAPSGPDVLVSVRGVRWGGGVFTTETASYHLRHLDQLEHRAATTFQLLDLIFIGSLRATGKLDRRPRSIRAGSAIESLQPAELSALLELNSASAVRLGELTSHPGVHVGISAEELGSAHLAIVGQTGSGKTNVQRLVRRGLQGIPEARLSYVVFDFHDEFRSSGVTEQELNPPFAFGPRDLQYEVLAELLPGLSLPQQDLLAVALDRKPGSIDALIQAIMSSKGTEASRRVLARRLNLLDKARAFSRTDDLAGRVASQVRKPGHGAILRLGSVQSELAQVFIGSVVRHLMVERMHGGVSRVVLLVDEAHRLMSPQASQTATRSFRLVAQEGRKFGVTMVLATQRPSLIDATILSQCGSFVSLRLTSEGDSRAVGHAMEVRAAELSALGVGQGIFRRVGSPDPFWIDFELEKGEPQSVKEKELRDPSAVRQQQLFDW